jgi:hypothetical protein
LLLRLLGLGFRFFGVFLTDRGDGVTEVMVEYIMEKDNKWNGFSDSNIRKRETYIAPATISLLPPLEANYNIFN